MNRMLQRAKVFLYDTTIDINDRLSAYFINIGIVAAILGVGVCLLAQIPTSGTLSTALIAVGAPLISSMCRHSGRMEHYGSVIGIMIIIMIPIVWLTTGANSGGSSFWFLYELYYITLFTSKKQRPPFYVAAVTVQAAAIVIDHLHPELFFHFTNSRLALISLIGSGSVVTAEILITTILQKSMYAYERDINTKTKDMTRNFVASIANTIDTKDPYTGGHSRRVAECASAIARRLGMSEAEADNLYFIALLHDIGKIGVPDRVLNKPGRLNDEEFALIRKHPVYGAAILRDVSTIPHMHDGVLYHHERYDGHGYPEGLSGEEIPYIARIITVADSYDAMSTNRIYRKSISHEEIIEEISRCRGTQFDPHIADMFINMLKEGFRIENDSVDAADSIENTLTMTATEMMSRIMSEDQLDKKKKGTTLVDNNEFSNLYDYLRNLRLRDGDEMLLVNISLEADNPEEDESRIQNCMVDLNASITQNIRSVDICTRNGNASYLVLLLDASRSNLAFIMERISTDFYKRQGSKEISMNYSIVETDAEIPLNK